MAEKKAKSETAEKTASGNGEKAKVGTGTPIQIASQYVKDMSFENPNAPNSVQGGAPAPQVAVNVDVRTQQLADNSYEVVLHIKGDAKAGDTQAFIVELSYGGVVRLSEGVPKEHIAPLLLIEAPRLLFPFARSVIAEATRDGGFPPMLVQPIDFADLFRRQVEAMKAQQKTG